MPFMVFFLEIEMKIVAWIIGVPVGILLLMMALGAGIKASESNSPPAAMTEKQKFEAATAECWQDYERKSLSAMEKINIAGFCEGLAQRAKDAR